ncbi:MAG: hypothetical protein NZ949_02875, partial [Candidatus Kapabacteria bacterium]|nr:hypothetical protein [Candidatus Kapabacteria bacterium]
MGWRRLCEVGVLLWAGSLCFSQVKKADSLTVEIARLFAHDLMRLNAVPFMQPLVTTINAVSNARFFRHAGIPRTVSSLYVRFGFHTMLGLVREEQQTYVPQAPTDSQLRLEPHARLELVNNQPTLVIVDTAGLVASILRYLFFEGIREDSIQVPERAATIFGYQPTAIEIPRDYLVRRIQRDPLYQLLSPAARAVVDSALARVPAARFDLPPGQNMRTLFAAVPQLEVGALWGTELALRFIPPVQWDRNVGDFAFWGIGLMHSLSQYWRGTGMPVESAVQIVYQGTALRNTIGETGARLRAWATIWSANLHVAYVMPNWNTLLYAGGAWEQTRIESEYTFTL